LKDFVTYILPVDRSYKIILSEILFREIYFLTSKFSYFQPKEGLLLLFGASKSEKIITSYQYSEK
jgi:hypothetical protein